MPIARSTSTLDTRFRTSCLALPEFRWSVHIATLNQPTNKLNSFIHCFNKKPLAFPMRPHIHIHIPISGAMTDRLLSRQNHPSTCFSPCECSLPHLLCHHYYFLHYFTVY